MPESFRPTSVLPSSNLEKALESINAHLAMLNARVELMDQRIGHLLNNQEVLANALATSLGNKVGFVHELLGYVHAEVVGGDHVRGIEPMRGGPVVNRSGDRLVPNSMFALPGSFAFGAVADDGTVWALRPDDAIVRWSANGSGWEPIDGRLRCISCPTASIVWGINHEHSIFQWNGQGWNQVDGKFAYVAAAADGTVVALAPDNTIWRRYSVGGWNRLPGWLRRVAIRSANEMIGVDGNDKIYQWTGADWRELDGRAHEVAIGGRDAAELWCVNRERTRFYRRNTGWVADKIGEQVDRLSMAGTRRLFQRGATLLADLA